MSFQGILAVDKPSGPTSRDVVNRVQRAVRPAKAGHAGTLDPLATGLVLVAIGAATRLIQYLQRGRKTYHATFLLGQSSDTEDVDGTVVQHDELPRPTRESLEAACTRFVGTISQTPPAFSALRVAGQRAYALARAGQAVTLNARPVEIYRLSIRSYDFPRLELDVDCGSGTYVRSLGRDIARTVGTEAVMSALRRTVIGEFQVADAVPYEALNLDSISRSLLSLERGVAELPHVTIAADIARRLRLGQRLAPSPSDPACDEYAALDERGRLVAIVSRRADGSWQPTHTFAEDKLAILGPDRAT